MVIALMKCEIQSFVSTVLRRANYCVSDDRQLFEIYESLPNASLDKMNDVIRAAVSLCTAFYICVGFFGYVAFCTQNFTGNYNIINHIEVLQLGGYLSQLKNMIK
jgi:amino acid permease